MHEPPNSHADPNCNHNCTCEESVPWWKGFCGAKDTETEARYVWDIEGLLAEQRRRDIEEIKDMVSEHGRALEPVKSLTSSSTYEEFWDAGYARGSGNLGTYLIISGGHKPTTNLTRATVSPVVAAGEFSTKPANFYGTRNQSNCPTIHL